jgi:hypothetical protein
MKIAPRASSRLVIALGWLLLLLSALTAAGGLAAAVQVGRPDSSAGTVHWAVLLLVGVGAAIPSLRLLTASAAMRAAPRTDGDRARDRHLAELGAVAWLLLAAIWLSSAPLATWLAAGTALSVFAGLACIPPSIELFRAWARLRA